MPWNEPQGHAPLDAESFVALIGKPATQYQTTLLFCLKWFTPREIEAILHNLAETENPGLRLSLGCDLQGGDVFDSAPEKSNDAIVQIRWRQGGPIPNISYFKRFSDAGVWNHLVVEDGAHYPNALRAALSQPNILHSWETTGPAGQEEPWKMVYAEVRPLPGRPLWQVVNDPMQRFILVDHLGKDRLLRVRVDEDGEDLFTVGSDLVYHFEPPDRLPAGYLDEICNMVAAGGTVATTHVRSNLERAYLVGYVLEKGVIVANSSLKHPRPQYIDQVRQQSGLDLTGYLERGYTSVRPEYRGLGLGTGLLAGLTQRAGDCKIFSVIAEDNEATKIIARRNRTRQVATYFSEKAGKPVGIWMPEWMIDP